VRALLAVVALSAGCDQLFQINQIGFDAGAGAHDGATEQTDAPIPTDPTLLGYGQQAYSDTMPYSTVNVTLAGHYDAGTLVVVAICEGSTSTGQTVIDGGATKYMEAVTAEGMVASPVLTAQLYYGILAAPAQQPMIQVEFTDAVFDPDVRVAAYANLATLATFESASATSGMATTSVTTVTQVPAAPTLLVAATCVGQETTAIDGFTIRTVTTPNGDALADTVTRSIGVATTTAHQNSPSGMILQVAAFQGIPAR